MRYLVTGSRDWTDWAAVRKFVEALRPGDEVAHGDARGADSMVHWMLIDPRGVRRAKRIFVIGGDRDIGERREGSRKGDINVYAYPADWVRHRREVESKNPAGHIRNAFMLAHFKPDACIYFCHDFKQCRGTKSMVDKATAAEVPVWDVYDFIKEQGGPE